MHTRPSWYTDDHDNAWSRVKAAFRNDWEQTKHDFGSKTARDLDQDVPDTLRQATGTDDTFDRHENAFRFGHAAQRNYRTSHPTWNDDLDNRLRQDYGNDYDRDRNYIRHAYEYRYGSTSGSQLDDRTGDRLR
jgi:hypothetical protein